MLVRVIAIALVAWSLVELTLYWIYCHQNWFNSHQKNVPLEMLPCVERSLPLLAGVALLVKSRALAEWISNILDE